MPTETEIASYLKNFKEKMKFWDVLFRDERGKNTQALVNLELRPIERKAILEALEPRDYSDGPIEEKLYGGADMWVFGKAIKKREVYIKITMGAMGASVICISFHLAQHKMNYPLKQTK
ncbi:MAG: toxin [Bacteroidia bacterium]|nr:toxin [Bacteroidia bacterium]MCF8428339.1 toxin [Bacteroidia bacterium]